MPVMNSQLRSLPSVDRLLAEPLVASLVNDFSIEAVILLLRQELDQVRSDVRNGIPPPDRSRIVQAAIRRASNIWRPWPKQVINATGVVLHTNLGRAPLSDNAVLAAEQAARGYVDLELNIDTGKRGSRTVHIQSLLAYVTGSEAGLAVNNNASAMLLGLGALASGREVIVSRGEAVEIGGGFRVPGILVQSGAKLVEVGTTNRTYIEDYAEAITDQTAAILKTHRSNFEISGFVHDVALRELVSLGQKHNICVLQDLGSGCLIDTTRFGLKREPRVQDSIATGVDLAFFSGDKLLGGPQAGLAVGSKAAVSKLASHPLARVVRCDKITLGALSATLMAYLGNRPELEIPIWMMIAATADSIKKRAEAWKESAGIGTVVETGSAIGGGSLPGQTIDSFALTFKPPNKPDEFCRQLRCQNTPIIARIESDMVVLDPRTVLEHQDDAVIDGIRSILSV